MNNQLNLENFRKLFEVNDYSEISQIRKKLKTIPFEWQEQTSETTTLGNLSIHKNQYRYSIEYNHTTFECLFFPSLCKKLVVSLCGGRDTYRYPRFLRWKSYNYLNANFLCIEDPMYEIFPDEKCVFWYYGTNDEWYIEKMSHIIHKFITLLDINIENVIFLGSSGGGTTAIHLANIFAGSCAVAMNPQYDISKWNIVINNLLKEKFNIDLNNDNDDY